MAYSLLAERAGFEPAMQFPTYTLSRRAPSTTRTPLLFSNRAAKVKTINILAKPMFFSTFAFIFHFNDIISINLYLYILLLKSFIFFTTMKIKNISLFILGIAVGAAIIAFLSFKNATESDNPIKSSDNGRIIYKWQPALIPDSINLAGEKTPLQQWEVREYFDRELQSNYFRHANMLYMLKLSAKHFPTIEKILNEQKVHDDFKYLCVAESSLQNLTSPAGAVGYWQFLKQTGISYGLEITDEVDERYDLEKSTVAACKYLKDAYKKFGNWTSAAASYNCGMGGVSSRSAFQQKTNYYDLLLPEETNRYIFRILAYKHLMSNAEALGFIVTDEDKYENIKVKNIEVTSTVSDLAQFAIDNGSNYKVVKMLNPWLRDKKLTVKPGKKYYISVPAK